MSLNKFFEVLGKIIVMATIYFIGKAMFYCIPNSWQYCFAYIYGGIVILINAWFNGLTLTIKEKINK